MANVLNDLPVASVDSTGAATTQQAQGLDRFPISNVCSTR